MNRCGQLLMMVLAGMIFSASGYAKELWRFDGGYALDRISASDAKFNIVDDVMMVKTGTQKDWPGITLKGPDGGWDISGFGQVSIDVENLSDESLRIHLRIDDPQGNGQKHSITKSIEIAADQSETLTVKLFATAWALTEPLELIGMRGYPGSQEKLDTSKIMQAIIFLNKPDKEYSFKLSNLRADGTVKYLDAKDFIPFIDKFGQFAHGHWPGKVNADNDLKDAWVKEQQDLAANSSPEHWNKYGGWDKGSKLKATGFFRVAKQKGQWWLIDPSGNLFWSHGSDCVNNQSATPITDRREYYSWLPDKESEYGFCYGSGNWAPHGYYQDKGKYETFDFAKANLVRKFGKDYYNDYALLCHRRLRSWGMNTIGNWSEDGIYLQRKTPYVASIHFTSRVIEGSDGYWTKFYDVFDPEFQANLKRSLTWQKGKAINDPWCIGFFVHNELGWGSDTSLALGTLISPADQPAKIKFIKILKAKYRQIEKLNIAWASEYASWDALLASQTEPDVEKAHVDLQGFYQIIAETYFSIIRQELKAIAPDQLYLGCRFAWVNNTAAKAASKYCDIVSYNRYAHSVEDLRLPDNIDKPIIIGEFHFGALDRGMFHTGLVSCTSQTDRADKYRKYVYGALRNPAIVGTHWFQFRDQSTTGRGDGENYQIGLLDICDNPYPETIDAVREIGRVLYDYRYAR